MMDAKMMANYAVMMNEGKDVGVDAEPVEQMDAKEIVKELYRIAWRINELANGSAVPDGMSKREFMSWLATDIEEQAMKLENTTA